MSIIIRKFESKNKWNYLWGKYITGINLNVHCAKSLLGDYSKLIDKDKLIGSDLRLDEFDSDIFYLCGVARPYNWHNNFHLALRYKEGNNIIANRNGLYLEIENAEELPIDFNFDKCDNELKYKKAYGTCRNWQFAYLYKDLFQLQEK